MRTRLYAVLGLAGAVLALAGCISLKRTPEARFFVLQSLAQPTAAQGRQEPIGIVGVEAVRLPGHLDRPQLITWTAPNELTVDEFLRWAEPLEDGITRTLVENLAALLPDYQVVRRPWPGGTHARCRVAVSLRHFGLQRDGTVQLDGRLALLPDRGERALLMQPVSMTRGPLPQGSEDAPPDPGVDVMSELLADLSRRVADAIRTLPPEEEPADEPAGPNAGDESAEAAGEPAQ
jgi:uncharacterized lipoprotein YmbA